MVDRPETPAPEPEWRAAGDRIQTLLDSCATGGSGAYDRAQQLVREVVGLYGAGLERILALTSPELAERLATVDLVASLLLVHGLHPHDVRRRVCDALDRVRPYLGSHGGDVELVDIADGTARLRFQGSCKSCPSSAVTLELAVEDAVRAAAPEISVLEVVTADHANVIPAQSLLTHVRSSGPTAWHPAPELADLAPGEVAGFVIADATVLACRVDEQLLVYRDNCPVCVDSLAGAQLRGQLLQCPRCAAEFDVAHAGAGGGAGAGSNLEPLPLLDRDGVPSVALPRAMLGASA